MDQRLFKLLDQVCFPQECVILMYHGLTANHGALENYHGKNLHILTFIQHLKHLRANYNVISLKQLTDCVRTRKPLPPNSVVITFDDGYESNYTLGFPALKEYGFPASIYLTTDFIEQRQFIWASRIEYALLNTRGKQIRLIINDQEVVLDTDSLETKKLSIDTIKKRFRDLTQPVRLKTVHELERRCGHELRFHPMTPAVYRPLSWGQIKEMSASGLIAFGSHTVSHPFLAQCTTDELNHEIVHSKTVIEEQLGSACEEFCYPYGDESAFNNYTHQALDQAGYTCALTTVQGTNNLNSDLFVLKRFGTDNNARANDFPNTLLKSYRAYRRFRRHISALKT